MPMPAVLATIAQQGQAGGGGGGSAPSNVSVATSSSGNFDDAVIVDCTSGSGVIVVNSGSTFSSGTGDIELVYGPAYSTALNVNSGVLTFETYGYCRATSATSFSWGLGNVQEVQDTNSAVSSVGKSGSGSTAQDRTSNDIGIEVNITHNSGGRGYLLLSASGDGFSWDVNCDATNSNGTTTSSPTVTPRILIP